MNRENKAEQEECICMRTNIEYGMVLNEWMLRDDDPIAQPIFHFEQGK